MVITRFFASISAVHSIFLPEEDEPLRSSKTLLTKYAFDTTLPPVRYTALSNSTVIFVDTETPVVALAGVTVMPVLTASAVVKVEVYSAFSLPPESSSDALRSTTKYSVSPESLALGLMVVVACRS